MHILYVDRPYTLDFNFFPIPSPLYVYVLIFFFSGFLIMLAKGREKQKWKKIIRFQLK